MFEDHADYFTYASYINQYAKKYKVQILAYCLMTNHVHFIAIPNDESGFARMFNTAHMRYSQYKNNQKKERGHLWQGRFFSCVMDDDHVMRAMRYVEMNPVRARMVRKAWKYEYSSAQDHCGERNGEFVRVSKEIQLMDEVSWREYITKEDNELYSAIKLITQKGLALGGETFVAKLAKKLGRSLEVRNPGRPFTE